jgi:hypothetical protein
VVATLSGILASGRAPPRKGSGRFQPLCVDAVRNPPDPPDRCGREPTAAGRAVSPRTMAEAPAVGKPVAILGLKACRTGLSPAAVSGRALALAEGTLAPPIAPAFVHFA